MYHNYMNGCNDISLKDMDSALLLTELANTLPLTVFTAILPAARLCAEAHRFQTRGPRKNLPVDTYTTHPFRVCVRLARFGVTDADVLRAALLHDTLEDAEDRMLQDHPCFDSAEDIVKSFSSEDALSYVKSLTLPPKKEGQSYADHVLPLLKSTEPVWLVKSSDLIDNAGSLGYMPDRKRAKRMAEKYLTVLPRFVEHAICATLVADPIVWQLKLETVYHTAKELSAN